MELQIIAYNGGYSREVDRKVEEYLKDVQSDVDIDFYTETNYTEEDWKLLNLFESTGMEAASVGAPFYFCLDEESPNIYKGTVVACTREKKYQVVLKLSLDNEPDADVTFTCGIHETFELDGDTVIIKNSGEPFMGSDSDMPSSQLKIYLY